MQPARDNDQTDTQAEQPLAVKLWHAIIPILLALQALTMPGTARAAEDLQCVPFARQLSGIQIYGDAHSWWKKAKGRYERGSQPQKGAVLSLKGHGRMRLGHVAVVSKIIDNRNILLSHSNWSPINGRRGQIERNVAAVDVSPDNDWSKVKIWYAPIRALGTTAYPVNGFIYPNKKPARNAARQWVSSKPPHQPRAPNRNLFARSKTAEWQKAAQEEKHQAEQTAGWTQIDNPSAPTDLIAELLDRAGN